MKENAHHERYIGFTNKRVANTTNANKKLYVQMVVVFNV